MLTESFYTALAAALGKAGEETPFWVAVGGGSTIWDTVGLPPGVRSAAALAAEVARKPVTEIQYLDTGGSVAKGPTPVLRMTVVFEPGEGTGTLRECGLFGGEADETAGSGVLLSYFPHARLEKDGTMSLSRTFTVNLSPTPVAEGSQETRWLGNTSAREVHDMENQTRGCRLDEIRFDHRYWFAGVEDALDVGYDRCAYCFGRALSDK